MFKSITTKRKPLLSYLGTLSLMLATMTAITACAEPQPSAANVESLSDLRWRYRLILIAAPEGAARQLKAMQENQAKLDERNVVWIVIDEHSAQSNLLVPLNLPVVAEVKALLGKSKVILIGKDGGVKARAEELNLEELFQLIDSMPMRQREMSLTSD
ncbi:MAG: DUF4174 domain-containing protein [Pseudomonadota bacterium]